MSHRGGEPPFRTDKLRFYHNFTVMTVSIPSFLHFNFSRLVIFQLKISLHSHTSFNCWLLCSTWNYKPIILGDLHLYWTSSYPCNHTQISPLPWCFTAVAHDVGWPIWRWICCSFLPASSVGTEWRWDRRHTSKVLVYLPLQWQSLINHYYLPPVAHAAFVLHTMRAFLHDGYRQFVSCGAAGGWHTIHMYTHIHTISWWTLITSHLIPLLSDYQSHAF